MVNKSFLNNGFFIIRNAFSKQLLLEIQKITNEIIFNLKRNGKSKKNNYKNFCLNLKKNNNNFFLINKNLQKKLIYERIYQKIFASKKFYKNITNILGKDLAFCDEPTININVPRKYLKQNYYFKDWHQEIWSGADTSSVIMWTPVFLDSKNESQLSIIKSSHNWGHIPHQNRRPINLPKNIKIFRPKINYTDIIIMHSMVLHKTNVIETSSYKPRLAIASMIRNFKFKNNAFENNKSWKIFSYSELSMIERKLGNIYLSPYRTLDLDQDDFSSGSIK
jgi:hypothetical protein|tara:strand:- start:275 stop:1108 length:834 start_codon:yes stop_codon:yes gene_type:complete